MEQNHHFKLTGFIKTFFTFSNKEFNSDYVEIWKDGGFDLASTFTFNPNIHSLNNFREILIKAKEMGIDVLVSDERVSYKKLEEIGKDAFIENVKKCFKDYGDISSFIGFFLGDEPWVKDIDSVIESNLIIESLDPSLTNFVNFFPYFKNENTLKILGCDSDHYVDYLINIISKGHYRLWGADHYGILWAHEKDRGTFQYFKTIESIKEAMKKTNTQCIFAGACVGHNNILQPDFNLLRWQLSIAFMNGFKGINWYKFYDTNEGLSSLMNGVSSLFPINIFKKKTQTYFDLKSINYWFNSKFGEMINELVFVKTFTKESELIDEKLISFHGDHGLEIIISKYVDKTNKPYYFAMNKDLYLPEVAVLSFKEKTKTAWLMPGEFTLINDD